MEYHQCTALMCCDSEGSCKRTSESRTFTVNGVSNTIYLGAVMDGTVLAESSQICMNAALATPAGTCSAGSYLEVSVGQCLRCDAACSSCSGPTNFDCISGCKYGEPDAR